MTEPNALDLAKGLDLIGREKPPMAMCPCGEPLISTMSFPRFEFCCIVCGRMLGFLDPGKAEETPELTARHAALREEWDEHVLPMLLLRDLDGARAWLRQRAALRGVKLTAFQCLVLDRGIAGFPLDGSAHTIRKLRTNGPNLNRSLRLLAERGLLAWDGDEFAYEVTHFGRLARELTP